MLSTRAILTVKYTPASATAGRAVGGFLRYVQHRDHTPPPDQERGIAGLVRYMAYRDVASPEGRLFDGERTVGSEERKGLVRYVRRSLRDHEEHGRPSRSAYRFVLSPEDARGLDLRQMARNVMAQLERDTGRPLPPWIAAEHRNTAHPHVHVILAARREEQGRFHEVRINRPRLARMKLALSQELERQRGARSLDRPMTQELLRSASRRRQPEMQRERGRLGWSAGRSRRRAVRQPVLGVNRFFRRLAFHFQREAERAVREWERLHGRDQGWER